MAWVAEPIRIWKVNTNGATELSQVELDAHEEAVQKWQKQGQENLFKGEER